ncbi:MAG: transketolase, partial [Oscillospiraceae bacterium]
GWNVVSCDAHDFDSLHAAFEKTKEKNGKPWVVIQKSVKGKGVSFMENNAAWHGTPPNDEQFEQAMKDLDRIAAELEEK